jgi:hypothetical protein
LRTLPIAQAIHPEQVNDDVVDLVEVDRLDARKAPRHLQPVFQVVDRDHAPGAHQPG